MDTKIEFIALVCFKKSAFDNEASKKMFELVGLHPLEKTENEHRYALWIVAFFVNYLIKSILSF